MEVSIFSSNLKQARKANNLSQMQAANLIGIGRPRLGAWEEGRAEPSIKLLKNICQAYRIIDVMSFINDPDFDVNTQVAQSFIPEFI